MSKLTYIAPSFIVAALKPVVAFYTEKLGFEILYIGPDPEPYFAMLGRDGVSLMFKDLGPEVGPLPNAVRHPWAGNDAFIGTPDPDGLYGEFRANGVVFAEELGNNSDQLRGFVVADADGYHLYFGRPMTEEERANG